MIHPAAAIPIKVIATKTTTNEIGTERALESPPRATGALGSTPAGGATPVSARPHSIQNLAPAIRGAPHCGQNRISKFLHDSFQTLQHVCRPDCMATASTGYACGGALPTDRISQQAP